MRPFIALFCAASLVGCATNGTISPAAFQQGQLFCAEATATGPLIVALENAAGVPVNVTGKEAATVEAACAAWSATAVPVAPPASATPASVPTVAAPVPALAKAA